MTPLELQLIYERLAKSEVQIEILKDSQKDLKSDIRELEETIKNNHEETQKSIKSNHEELEKSLNDLKETLVMGKGMKLLVGWISGIVLFAIAVFKFIKP